MSKRTKIQAKRKAYYGTFPGLGSLSFWAPKRKLELGAKASRVDKRSGRAAYDAAVTAVARRYACSPSNVSTKTVVPIQGDGNRTNS